MKIFISQPMANRPDGEIVKERLQAIEQILKKYPGTIIDSIIQGQPPEGANVPVWYLAKSIELLATADMAVFLPDWDNARGCVIENMVCGNYGIPILYLNMP